MKRYIFRITFLFSISLHACSNQQQAKAVIQVTDSVQLSASLFNEKLKNTEDAILLDVRTKKEFLEAHIKNAINMYWNSTDFKTQVAQLDKSKPISFAFKTKSLAIAFFTLNFLTKHFLKPICRSHY